MKLVAGLGNPGPQYEGTRHNIGFDVLKAIGVRRLATWRASRFEAQIAEILISDRRVLLLAPLTFMNLSGRSIKAAMTFYKVLPEDLLVICDDLNLPLAQLRMRKGGSAGGQKGLQNTIDQLGTQDFCRLRIGIDRPSEGGDVTSYVLRKFSKSERANLDPAIDTAVMAVEAWVQEGPDAAMNQFNRALPSADE